VTEKKKKTDVEDGPVDMKMGPTSPPVPSLSSEIALALATEIISDRSPPPNSSGPNKTAPTLLPPPKKPLSTPKRGEDPVTGALAKQVTRRKVDSVSSKGSAAVADSGNELDSFLKRKKEGADKQAGKATRSLR
jgi:hypothetical protein